MRPDIGGFLPFKSEYDDGVNADNMENAGNSVELGEKNSPLRPTDYSDAGNSQVFAQICGKTLSWCDALGWLYFNGINWEQNDHEAVDLAKGLTGMMLEDAKNEYTLAEHRVADAKTKLAFADDGEKAELKEEQTKAKEAVKEAKDYLVHAQKSRSVQRIKGMLELAKSSLVVKVAQLDADPHLLNTPSGVIDLRTGQIIPHYTETSSLYCTRITKVSPAIPGSVSDHNGEKKWRDFLRTITCEDDSVAGFLQMVAGMALIGKVYHEGVLIANGCGRNGKSTFFNALADVLGDYAGYIDSNVLTTDRQNRGAALATLRGKRLVIAPELEEHQRLSTSTLKKVATIDKLTIEEKYRSPEDIEQSHTLVLFTNHLPRVGATDDGTWRRIAVAPFNAVISESEGIQNYADVLVKDAGPVILSWAVEGAMNFIRNAYKLTIPDAVAEATEEYRERENWLESFITDCCVKEPGAKAGAKELYSAYREWSSENGEFIHRAKDFASALKDAGFRDTKPGNRRTWHGLRLMQRYGNIGTPWGATG